ncbi:hypothetical protein FN846DRAFT_951562 [Sphaerosporella brunnea]|uniref:Probable quinone oxidoreductase n=1 Tax=Sphaerosporella brunnea TaxID=1250544 RepID=A0A5J5EW25_9PEZI|nr:hypothetical protein FN846DRAFT_951562 [Sphaerosporella brunnea]
MASIPQTQTALQINRTGGPEVLELNPSAPVSTPGDNQILVKNTYAGVNYIDTYFRSGLYPPSPLPYTLGREGEGTVVSVGSGVTDFKVGDYIGYTGLNAQAEFTLVDPTMAIKVPDGIQPGITAAALIQGLTALTLIRESYEVKKGDAILVHAAAGGVGLWLLQLLRMAGAGTIIATASTAEKLELAAKNGATHGINYTTEDWVARVKEITGGAGVIAVFDGVGASTFEGDLEVLARKGTLASFGNASGPVPPFSISRLAAKNLKVLRPTLFNYVHTKEEFTTYSQELLNLIKDNKVDVRIHKVYELADALQVHKDIEGRGTTGKLLYKL